MPTRLDSRLENVGAEFLVLGHLLIEKIEAHKAYTNYPGYDIVAINPESERTCRIQVKSRWATDYNKRFPIKNFDCDFVVLAALNRGYRGYRHKPETGHPRRVASRQISTSSPSMSFVRRKTREARGAPLP